MFGLFDKTPAPEGPVEFEATAEINASAGHFFRLIDFASPHNAKIELGHRLRQTGPDKFELIMSFMPDLAFELAVEESVPNRRYAYLSPVPEGLGKLRWTRESYDIEATGEDSCVVTVKTEGEFTSGMGMKEYQDEVAMLMLACSNAFAKLRIHAEGGVAEVRAFEEEQAATM